MGTDTPLAVLSNKSQPLYNYFKQLFAQVTNPPIDPIREELVTSTETTIGAEDNLFEESPRHCRQLQLQQPILTNEELERIKRLERRGSAHDHALHAVPRGGRRGRTSQCARRALQRRFRRNRFRLHDNRAFRSRSERGLRGDPRAARDRSSASSLDSRRHAHAGRPRRRIRRAAGGDAFLPAGRLRRGRRQSVPRVRNDGGDDSRRPTARHRRRYRGPQLRQGRRQEHHESRVQDGDLDDAELSRRANLRGDRTGAGRYRQVLHLDAVARGRRRPRRDRARDR